MAFNPLHALRKRQKSMMAALVLVCMVTFILSSGIGGGGDFFDWLRATVTGSARANEVATVYGNPIDDKEFLRLRNQRMLAHQYMALASQQAMMQVQEQLQKLSEESKKKLGDGSSLQEQIKLQARLSELRQRQPGQGQHYFGGSLSPDELFDFVIWKKQADRLGIQLTEADVIRERNQETGAELDGRTLAAIERSIAAGNRAERLTKELLITALGDEFRVRLAKAALLGPDAPAPRQPMGQFDLSPPTRLQTSFTPHEFWEYYKHNLTSNSVRLLPIPVREFLPQVKDTPTDEELLALFEKHKNDEPNPALAAPGFKQPRRIQIDWVSANANEPPYPRAAEVSLALLEATMPLAFTNQLLTEYNQQKFRFRLPGWGEEQSGKALLPALKQADFENATRLRALGLYPTGASILAAVLGSFQAKEVAHDLKDLGAWIEEETKARQQFLASALALGGLPLPPLMPTGLSALGVAARKHQGDAFGQHLPLSAVKRYLVRNLRDEAARQLVRSNLETFRKELEKYRSRPEEARKFVADAVARLGLRSGGMTQPRDQHTLFEDPAMQPLRDPLKDTYRFIAQFQGPRELATLLDDDPKGRVLSYFVLSSLNKTFAPQDTLRGETTYVYWLTADKPAFVPKFEEVRDQVVEAWKLKRARELAKKEADRIAEEAKKAGNAALQRLIDGSAYGGKLIDLYGVTRLKPPEQSALPGRERQYTPYRLPRAEVEFPTQQFIDKLLELKNFGDVAVLHDLPEEHYYVVTPLSKRFEPLPGEFYAIYKRSSPAEFFPDPLIGQFDQERRARQREAVLAQLRAEAKLKKNDEVIKALAEER